mmetsp:Transcript_25209/g.45378  ORF Transcript_25209/g.45378 Transcript_25209/m.45378 type:complete len:221 (-) Transcript_25209:359-1021(-)
MQTSLASAISLRFHSRNLPHHSGQNIVFFRVRLDPDHGGLTEYLANNDLVDVFHVLVKAEAPTGPEDTLDLTDDDLRIEILAQEQRAHHNVKGPGFEVQPGRVALPKAQAVALLVRVPLGRPQIRGVWFEEVHSGNLVAGPEEILVHTASRRTAPYLEGARPDPQHAKRTVRVRVLRLRVNVVLVWFHPVDRPCVRRGDSSPSPAHTDGRHRSTAKEIAA